MLVLVFVRLYCEGISVDIFIFLVVFFLDLEMWLLGIKNDDVGDNLLFVFIMDVVIRVRDCDVLFVFLLLWVEIFGDLREGG